MKNKNLIIGVIVLILILAGVGYLYNQREQKSANDQQLANGTENASSTGAASTTTKKLSYGEAIKTYKFRFQFQNCSGNPGLLSVKKGTPVMLDNRDNKAHTIRANGQSVRIAAYDYAVIYPSQITKDSTDLTLSNVTCDGGGAATLNVER